MADFYIQTLINSVDKPLTFKPDLEMGEGTPTDEEVQYRQSLLDLAKDLHQTVEKRFNTISNPNDLIKKIDVDINDFIQEGQKLILKFLPIIWNDNEQKGLKILKKLAPKKSFDESKINTTKRDKIIQQQQMNIEDIGLRLRGRLRQVVNLTAIQSTDKAPTQLINTLSNTPYPSNWTRCMIDKFKEDPTLTEEELRDYCEGRDRETGFNEVQNNMDLMGWFGYISMASMATLATVRMGTAIIGDLIADWFTCEEDPSMDRCDSGNPVCDECLDMRDMVIGVSILDSVWDDLGNIHPWCRCGMGNIRLANT